MDILQLTLLLVRKLCKKDNLTKEQMYEKIDKYPITKGLKEKVKAKIRES